MRPETGWVPMRYRIPRECLLVLSQCMRRVRRWRVPPHWSAAEWYEEALSEATAAVHEAMCRFDPNRGIELKWYVRRRILLRVLARYRKEWAFGLRWLSSDDAPADRGIAPTAPRVDDRELRTAMNSLTGAERRLMEALFWERRTESDLARKMGISQQEVSKRKLVILIKLRHALDAGA
jgi:RNA polymerase sigma factor (sigma-70 family)